jgi:TIGR03009 family protein
MRYHWLALVALALAYTSTSAQQLQTPQAQVPADPKLNQSLVNWQSAVKGLKSFEVELTRYELDAGFKSVDVWKGTAKYLGPDRAVLKMDKQGKPEGVYEKYVCTGTYVYSMASLQKTIYAYELPKKGQLADDNVLSVLFTIKPEDATRRYSLRFQGEDKSYLYIGIVPRTPEDKADFAEARLALLKDSFLPREIWYKSANGNETRWDITKIQLNVKVDVQEFEPPKPPPGWKVERNVQPRVVREKQP